MPASRGTGPASTNGDGQKHNNITPWHERSAITEDQLRALVDLIPIGAFVWSSDRTIYVNAAAERLTGYPRDELLRLGRWDLAHPDSLQSLQEYASTYREGQPIPREYELKIVTKDGAIKWVLMTLDRVDQECGEPFWIGTAMDITSRKAGEDALRHSEARYRILYEDNPTMYFTVAPDGTVLDVNSFGAAQLGYRREDLTGTSVLDIFFADDRESVRRQMRSLLGRPGETAVWEFRKVRRDGAVIWVEEQARATRDAEGNAVVLVVCEDITERRRLEEELIATREELEKHAERLGARGLDYGMSFRELTVLQLVAEGKPDKEIAAILGITRMTVSKHVARILRKLRVNSRTAASVRAVQEGLVAVDIPE
jgi:PAS domain S-box-containing protein